MIKNNNILLKYFFYLLITVFIIDAIYFAFIVHDRIIRADQWRFISLYLYPLEKGTFNIGMLWSDHHPEPLTALLFIISAKYFDLTLNLYYVIGIAGKVLFTVFFLYLANKSIKNISLIYKFIFLLTLVSSYLGLKSITEYGWPLVTLSNIWLFLYLMILYYIDIFFKESVSINSFLILFLIFVFILIGIKDFSMIFIGAITGVVSIIYLFQYQYKKLIYLLVIALMSFVVFKIFFITMDIHPIKSNGFKYVFNLENIVGLLSSIGVMLFSAISNISLLKSFGISDNIVTIGYFLSLSYLIIFSYYMKNKLYKISIIPVVLMSFSFLFMIAIIFYRYPPNGMEVDFGVIAPRYIGMYELGITSMLWALFIIIDNKKFKQKKVIRWIFSISLVIIFINIINIQYSWKNAQYVKTYFHNAELILKNYPDTNLSKIPKGISGGSFSEEKVKFLKKHKYNVFSNNYIMEN